MFGEWVAGYGLPGDGSESWPWVRCGFVWLLADLSGSQATGVTLGILSLLSFTPISPSP